MFLFFTVERNNDIFADPSLVLLLLPIGSVVGTDGGNPVMNHWVID